MANTFVRIALALVIVAAAAPGSSRAQSLTRVRIEPAYLQSVVTTAVDRSQTLRGLIARIDASNVIVYVTCEHFQSQMLRGRTIMLSGTADVRYVRVQVDCMLPAIDLAAIVGHELRHVNEIAAAATVVDTRSLRQLYGRIGFETCRSWRSEQFETTDALEAGARVREEYIHRAASQIAAAGGRYFSLVH